MLSQPSQTQTPNPTISAELPVANAPTTVTSTSQQDSVRCIAGFVLSGGDLTPSGLTGTPRTFEYQIATESGETWTVRYTAFPPSDETSTSLITLNFHAGTIQIHDYIEACGMQNSSSNLVVISEATDSITTFPSSVGLIVRHAERASQAPNSDLNAVGLSRANALKMIAADLEVSAIYSTEYCRTMQTAQPSAIVLDLPIQIQSTSDPNSGLDNCDPAITARYELVSTSSSIMALIQSIKNNYPDHTVLIVAHSDSAPQFAEQLSGKSVCPDFLPFDSNNNCFIPNDEFNHIFKAIFSSNAQQGLLLHETYAP